MGEGLASVTYQAKLGSVADKVARVAALAEAIAAQVGVDPAAGAPRRANCRRPTCSRAWSTNSRNCRASPAATTPRADGRSAAKSPPRSTRPTCRAFAGDAIAPSKLGPGAGDRRAPGHAGRRLRRGLEADRQQGSVRAAAQCVGPGAHAHRRRVSTLSAACTLLLTAVAQSAWRQPIKARKRTCRRIA